MPNLAALRAAIFLLSAKNRWGGGGTYVPPPAVRGLRPSLHYVTNFASGLLLC